MLLVAHFLVSGFEVIMIKVSTYACVLTIFILAACSNVNVITGFGRSAATNA